MACRVERAAVSLDLHNPADKLVAAVVPHNVLAEKRFCDPKSWTEIEGARELFQLELCREGCRVEEKENPEARNE